MEPRNRIVVLLLLTLGVTLWLVGPFLDAVLIGAVVAILAWPVQRFVLRLTGRRRRIATAVTIVALTLGVFAPAGALGLLAARELVTIVNDVAQKVQLGETDLLVTRLAAWSPAAWVAEWMGGPQALADTIEGAVRDGALAVASAVTQSVPNLLSVTATAVLKLVIALTALATLLHSGPDLLRWGRRVSPLTPEHTDRLYAVFFQFTRNVVLAGLAAGVSQGVVAGLGYWLADVDRWLLFGLLTAILAYIPLVGTTLVWLPLAVLLIAEGRPNAALFVVIWSLAVTGTVDNVVRPFIVRGSSGVPLLLVFLGVFGGLYAFGVVGVLVGPVLMALLLALFAIFVEESDKVGGV